MQTIPQTFRQASMLMRLEKREGNAALYANTLGDYFEVHRVRVRKAERAFNRDYPEREVLAGDEEFGRYGWACVTRDRAEARFADVPAPA